MKLNFLISFLLKPSESHDRCGSVKLGESGQFPLTSLSSYPGSGNTWVRKGFQIFKNFRKILGSKPKSELKWNFLKKKRSICLAQGRG